MRNIRLSIVAAALVAALAGTACVNSRPTTIVTTTTSAGDSTPGDPNSPIQIKNVLRDNLDPAGTLDIIGDPTTDALGQYCTPTANALSGATSNPGESSCTCYFQYTVPPTVVGNSAPEVQEFNVPTTYHENNMVRCSYTQVPPQVGNFFVVVQVSGTSTQSNAFSFAYQQSSANLSLASPSAYVPVKRYQCRDIVTIPYAFGGSLYDPVQSEDPSISYPLDYYTTNMGATFSYYSGLGVTSWDCPSLPNDPAANLNLWVYSEAPDNGNSVIFSPETPSVIFNPRSDFYLSPNPAGVFTVPVNAYLAPQIPTSYPGPSGITDGGGGPPPSIGYGAASIPNSAGGEDCPNVTIPPGWNWAKLWLFRADLPGRTYLTSTAMTNLGSVTCNPGLFPDATAVFPDCNTAGGPAGGITFGNGSVVDRVSGAGGAGVCYNLNGPIAACNTKTTGAGTGAGCVEPGQAFAQGSDVWVSKQNVYKCPLGSTLDPMNVCQPNATVNGTATPLGTSVPYDPHPVINQLDTPTGGSSSGRFDFLWTVSPAVATGGPTHSTVNLSDMQNAASTIAQEYTPFRFMSTADCDVNDPQTASCVTAANAGRKITYGLKLHDVDTNGDPAAGDPTRPNLYPICVLQNPQL